MKNEENGREMGVAQIEVFGRVGYNDKGFGRG